MRPTQEVLFATIHKELGMDPERLTLATRLDELGDSLDWVNLLGAIEDEFKVRIPVDQALESGTIRDLLQLLISEAEIA